MSEDFTIMTGNEACTRAALAAGMNFFAGYPITPATEIAELSSQLLPQRGGKYIQMEDELASIACVLGASFSGAKAMTATSGPGFTLMQENLGYGMMCEVPCVVVDVQRQGPCQGMPTKPAQGDLMQARWGTHGDHPVVAIAPNSIQEMYWETIRAFNLSELLRTPVLILSDATLAHMSEKIRIPDPSEYSIINRNKPTGDPSTYLPYNIETNNIAPMAAFGGKYHFFASGLTHDDSGFPVTGSAEVCQMEINHLMGKIDAHLDQIEKYESYLCDDADVVILSVGLVSRSAKTAVNMARKAGIKAGLFRPITLWPFPAKQFSEITAHAKTVMTVEMNAGQLADVAREYTDRSQNFIPVTQSDGDVIVAAKILAAMKEAN